MKQERAAGRTQAQQEMKSVADTASPSSSASANEAHFLEKRSLSSLDRRRLDLEMGTGGDHDSLYSFSLPTFLPQILAWVQLLTKVQRGALQP
jgi:hypothetical protein